MNRSGDERLLAILGESWAEAARRAGPRLACRPGCTECCVGPFPINGLDAARLRDGLRRLADADPARGHAVRGRARAALARWGPSFPGDARTGRLGADDDAVDRFLERHADEPCPALDPATGRCDLYDARPLSCRTFGPPTRIGAEDLPPCRLCFVGSSPAEIEACRVEVDPEGLEGTLLEDDGETLVAFALATDSESGP